MAMDIDISEQLINYNYLEFGRFWFDDMNDTHDTKSLLLYHDTFVSNGCDLSLLIEEKSDDFIESCLRTTMPKHSSVVDYQTVLFIIQKIEHLRVQHEQFTSILNYCNCTSHLALFKQYVIHTVRAFLSRFESKDALKSFFGLHAIKGDDPLDKLWNCMYGHDADLMQFPYNEGQVRSRLRTLVCFKSKIQSELILCLQQKHFVWQWKDGNNRWHPYDTKISKELEAIPLQQCIRLCIRTKLIRRGQPGRHAYTVARTALESAIQTNVATHDQIPVRRIETGNKYPAFWIEDDCDDEKNSAKLKLVPKRPRCCKVTANLSYAFQRSFRPRKANGKRARIIKIESVQNKYLYDQYYNQKQLLLDYLGADKLNERNLFHGTTQEVMNDIIKDGFRKEYSRRAQFGQGTYFTPSAKYAARFCKPIHSQPGKCILKMLACKVICGETFLGHNRIKLQNWPKKQDGHIYDSLVNTPNNPLVYVIHKDARAYPMFIITFCYDEIDGSQPLKPKSHVACIAINWSWSHLASDDQAGPNGRGFYLGSKVHWYLLQNNIRSGAQLIHIGTTDVSGWEYTAIKVLLDQFVGTVGGPQQRRLVFKNK
eukprot:107615_1